MGWCAQFPQSCFVVQKRLCERAFQVGAERKSAPRGRLRKPLVVVGSINADYILQCCLVGQRRLCIRSYQAEAERKSAQHGCLMKPLVVVGSINADYVLPIGRLPKPGETLAAAKLDVFPGGKGANQAVAAAKLGYETYFVGQVGTDSIATTLRASLRDVGVNDCYVRVVEGSTGSAMILLQPSGENSIVIVGGANTASWHISGEIMQLVRSAGAVLLQREIPEEVNWEVARVASEAGVPVVLDAGGREGPLDPQLLQYISVLSPNETELSRLTGLPTSTEADILVAASQLQSWGVRDVLVKLGADGALIVSPTVPGGHAAVPAFPVAQVVDTTGAGDCFTAAFAAAALLEGYALVDAMRFAAAAAAVCVQRVGAQPSMPSREEAWAVQHDGQQ